jgi:hypothetical protein
VPRASGSVKAGAGAPSRFVQRRAVAGAIQSARAQAATARRDQPYRPVSATPRAPVVRRRLRPSECHPTGPDESRPKQSHSGRRPRLRFATIAPERIASSTKAAHPAAGADVAKRSPSAIASSAPMRAAATGRTSRGGTPKSATPWRWPSRSASLVRADTANVAATSSRTATGRSSPVRPRGGVRRPGCAQAGPTGCCRSSRAPRSRSQHTEAAGRPCRKLPDTGRVWMGAPPGKPRPTSMTGMSTPGDAKRRGPGSRRVARPGSAIAVRGRAALPRFPGSMHASR